MTTQTQTTAHDGQSLFASQLAADIAALIPAVELLSDHLNLAADTATAADNGEGYQNFPMMPDGMRANVSDLPEQMRDLVTVIRSWAKGEMLRHAADALTAQADQLQPR